PLADPPFSPEHVVLYTAESGWRASVISSRSGGRPSTFMSPSCTSMDTRPPARGMRSTLRYCSFSGSAGCTHTLPCGTHGSNRSNVRRNSSDDAAAHAWGEHDVG